MQLTLYLTSDQDKHAQNCNFTIFIIILYCKFNFSYVLAIFSVPNFFINSTTFFILWRFLSSLTIQSGKIINTEKSHHLITNLFLKMFTYYLIMTLFCFSLTTLYLNSVSKSKFCLNVFVIKNF